MVHPHRYDRMRAADVTPDRMAWLDGVLIPCSLFT